MLHLFKPLGPGQVRGISWLAPVLIRAGELDQLDDALLVGAKVAAMFAGFLIDQNGSATGFPFEGVTADSIMQTGLEPGTLKVLPAGFDIKFSGPQNAQQTVDFAKLQLRGIAAGLGIPEYLLTGDLTGANYSSLRAGLIEFRSRVEAIQFHTLVPQLLRPIWSRFVTTAVLSGNLEAADFEANAADYFACEWIMPAQTWIDPEKDAKATAAMIDAGLTSRRRAVAAQGYSVEELDEEIISDREREKELGLSFAQAKEAANVPA
jgi:lambda family phage portal protein